MTHPALATQLTTGLPTEGEDCVPAAILNIALDLSDGKVGPKPGADGKPRKPQDPQSVASWVKAVRKAAKRPSGALFIGRDALAVLQGPWLKAAFKAQNLKPLKVTYRYGIPFGEMRAWLAARPGSRMVLLPVMYGIARRDGAPMGSATFSDAHGIAIGDVRRKRVRVGKRMRQRWVCDVADALMDGRRRPGSTKRYPRGWQRGVRLYAYRGGAGGFGSDANGDPRPIGFGNVICIYVERG